MRERGKERGKIERERERGERGKARNNKAKER